MNNQAVLKLDAACKEDILQSCQMGFMKIILPAKSNADTRPCMYVDAVMASMFAMADNLSPQACYTYWASRIIAQEIGPQNTPNVQVRIRRFWFRVFELAYLG